MNKTALVIMAAGMGSRYGGGIKQLEHVGTSGEIIMEYSIYDAIEAGFDKVVFITRRELYEEFKKIISPEVSDKCEVQYVFQELDNVPDGFTVPDGRTKPWGTGHAILSCLGSVKEPFAVINADDYYGKEAFVKIHDFLANVDLNKEPMQFSMVGFVLKNTLSENGKVTRGQCVVNSKGVLENVCERYEIYKDGDVARAKSEEGEELELSLDTPVSMNMWGFTPAFLDILSERFNTFLQGIGSNPLKAEFLLPNIVGNLVTEKLADVTVLTSNDKWFGVTYKEDKDFVVESFKKLCEEGKYPVKLFNK